MALQKDTEIGNTGLFCNYIKIQGFLYESENGKIQITLGIYSSKEASQSGKESVSRTNMDIELLSLSGNGDIREQIYNKLKSLPAFDGAIDV